MAEDQQGHSDRGPSPDDVAQTNINRVRDAVKQIQSRETTLTSPVPKPRRLSPASSPALSPELPHHHDNTTNRKSSPAPSPVVSRLMKVQTSSSGCLTPPASPMRRRSEGFKNGVTIGEDSRPKPPVRKRRKKFATDDNDLEVGSNRNAGGGHERHSIDVGEYANISFSEMTDGGGGEGGGGGGGGGGVKEGETMPYQPKLAEEEENEKEEKGEEGGGGERARLESFIIVEGVEENTKLTPQPPSISSVKEEEKEEDEEEEEEREEKIDTTTPNGHIPISTTPTSGSPPSDSSYPIATETVAEEENSTRQPPQPHPRAGFHHNGSSIHLSGKKKPPPLPNPYQSRPPPLPIKQRSIQRQATDSVVIETVTLVEGNRPSSANSTFEQTTEVPTTTVTMAPVEHIIHRQLSLGNNLRLHPPSKAPPPRPPSPQRLRKSSPNIFSDRQTLSPGPPGGGGGGREVGGPESPGGNSRGSGVISPIAAGNSVEVRVLTSRPDTMPKHHSYGSSDSLELSEGNSLASSTPNRHSTIAVARVKAKNRSLPSGKPNLKGTRPLSDASLNLLEGYDVVLPVGHLHDVMKSVITNDEKMQEASIYEVVQACMKAMPHVTSTRELPSQIVTMPTDTRSKVIHELYTTEYTYVRSLETLSEVFKDPLAAVLGEESGRIFANIDNILAFNKGFLALLHSRLSSWKTDSSLLGELFIGMFNKPHRSMYAIYCSNFDSAEQLLQQKKKKKEFEQQLAICLQNPRVGHGLNLTAYLLTPVQRVPRYILLLKDIIKRTPEEHPDYQILLKAKEVMNELAGYIDAQIRESQTKKTFDTLKNKVLGLADLDSQDRSLVKEGQCFLKNIKKLYQCILFNDILVFAHGDSKQSKVELQLSLEGVWVEDLEDLDPQTSNQDAIEVYTPDRPYTVYTQTSLEKKLWLAKLRETIYQMLLKEGKCTRSSRLDTDQRTATFVYSDGRLYAGNFTCARRQGKGTMVWPDNSKYIGDWVDDERHGEGQFTFNTREVYEGKWVEDRITGYGKMTFASEDKYIGYWKDGMRHGKGKIVYSNGDSFEGHFKEGQIEGEGSLRCRNGLEYIGHWKHSQRHGQGRLRTVLGNTYEGEFSRNQIHGTGRMTYHNGDYYDGQWKVGTRHGQGKFVSKREGAYEGSWYNDLRQGKGKQEYPNKDYYDGTWELNLRHGKGVLSFATGEKYKGDFSYDMISGEGEMFYSDDCRYNGQWMNGLYHGQGIMVYNDTSSIKSTYNGDWRYGLRHGQGELVMFDGSVYRGLWSNDKPHGKGNYSVPTANYYYSGDWIEGKKEGKGEENSQLGLCYKGQWRGGQRWGTGEEKTLVGTTFTGHWERDKKHGRGSRRTVTGMVEQQVWQSGVQTNDLHRRTAVELPQLSRLDYF